LGFAKKPILMQWDFTPEWLPLILEPLYYQQLAHIMIAWE